MVLERATPELFPEHQVRNELPPHKRILQNLYRLYHLYDPLPMPAVFDQSFEDIRYWNNQRMDHQVYLAGVIFQRDDLTIDNLSAEINDQKIGEHLLSIQGDRAQVAELLSRYFHGRIQRHYPASDFTTAVSFENAADGADYLLINILQKKTAANQQDQQELNLEHMEELSVILGGLPVVFSSVCPMVKLEASWAVFYPPALNIADFNPDRSNRTGGIKAILEITNLPADIQEVRPDQKVIVSTNERSYPNYYAARPNPLEVTIGRQNGSAKIEPDIFGRAIRVLITDQAGPDSATKISGDAKAEIISVSGKAHVEADRHAVLEITNAANSTITLRGRARVKIRSLSGGHLNCGFGVAVVGQIDAFTGANPVTPDGLPRLSVNQTGLIRAGQIDGPFYLDYENYAPRIRKDSSMIIPNAPLQDVTVVQSESLLSLTGTSGSPVEVRGFADPEKPLYMAISKPGEVFSGEPDQEGYLLVRWRSGGSNQYAMVLTNSLVATGPGILDTTRAACDVRKLDHIHTRQ